MQRRARSTTHAPHLGRAVGRYGGGRLVRAGSAGRHGRPVRLGLGVEPGDVLERLPHAPHAVRLRGMRRQPGRARIGRDLAHLLPQRDAGLRVVAGTRGDLHADEVGVLLVVAVELEVEQAAALARELADVAADHQADGERADAGERGLGRPRAGMLAQRVRHLVAQHHRQLVVGELERVENAREHGNLAARHAQRVDGRRLDQDHLPAPVLGARVPLVGVRQQVPGDAADPLGLRVLGRQERIAAHRLAAQLAVLLQRRLLEVGRRHQVAHQRRTAAP